MSSTVTYPGLFITFEGGDSCGKSTQIASTKQWLEESGIAPLLTREPGGTELGEKLRELIIHGPDDMDSHTEALLYSAQRAYHMETKVRPALLRGEVVLQDRYLDSSVAYQGAARELGVDEILQLNLWAVKGLLPDVTIFLDLDPEVAFARRTGEPDRLEREPNSFQHRVREQYYELSKTYPDRYRVIDASGDVQSVQRQIRQALEPFIEKHLHAGKVGHA
ncbi:dTMP kinase [Gleimia europaea]|uniref:Thymidylate kinase n=1 Tax=Gleimia europaea ACS-120-V-Col10b TaxID=883069 RepID=A0A9W5RFH5_9ACTO|nr:dTMP kinase [Gleimia europaea]EPD31479.1 thymidylate kinase [Gleimia europaea ACS-120-V-Col10b]